MDKKALKRVILIFVVILVILGMAFSFLLTI